MPKHHHFLLHSLLAFVGMPLLLLYLGNAPVRSHLKESLSLVTILSFSLLLWQFFTTPSNTQAIQELRATGIRKVHAVAGYICTGLLLAHPLFLVVPRFFDRIMEPTDAFVNIITTFTGKGIVFGMISWSLLMILGITSFFRNNIPLTYVVWRRIHGVLAILFVAAALIHVQDLGRHANLGLSSLFIVMAGSGVLLLLTTYRSRIQK